MTRQPGYPHAYGVLLRRNNPQLGALKCRQNPAPAEGSWSWHGFWHFRILIEDYIWFFLRCFLVFSRFSSVFRIVCLLFSCLFFFRLYFCFLFLFFLRYSLVFLDFIAIFLSLTAFFPCFLFFRRNFLFRSLTWLVFSGVFFTVFYENLACLLSFFVCFFYFPV